MPTSSRISPCDWAGCGQRGIHQASEWEFCGPHLAEHRSMVAHDAHFAQVRTAELRFEQQVRSACRGRLLPSGSLRAVIDVLTYEIRVKAS